MAPLFARNRQFLTGLFSGPFRGHALIVSPPPDCFPPLPGGRQALQEDYTLSSQPVAAWVPQYVQQYQGRLCAAKTFDDDAVPYVSVTTNTGIFAAAFGCPVHVYAGQATNAAARPIVWTAAQADRLAEPGLDAPTLARIFELARLLRRELGPEVPISVPDIQSPFDIAALIWNKEDLFLAMLEAPQAVLSLTAKCCSLLKRFLIEYRKQIGECNLCHCPYAWAPAQLGCWLSEDEVGSISRAMFARFCLPFLTELSETFGGLFMHCCANAGHQYGGFQEIPNLRGLNRVFQAPGPGPAIQAFAGKTVLMQAWSPEEFLNNMLDLAQPDSRFLFNLEGPSRAEIAPVYERLRKRCPRN
ncbi:MAG: uroporphyrinogen decarboxylase family protein [Planctomycetota bacterium]